MAKVKVIKNVPSKERKEVNYLDLRMKKKRILTPEAAAEYFKKLFTLLSPEKYEKLLLVIGIDDQNRPLYAEFISKLDDENVGMISRDNKFKLFRTAILNNADRLLIGQIHRNADPTLKDIKFYNMLRAASHELGLPAIDHLIVVDGKQQFYSCRKEGITSSSVRHYYWNSGNELYLYMESLPKYG